MTGGDLLRDIQAHGATIWAEGDRLELEIPDNFPETLIVELRDHKAEILAELREPKPRYGDGQPPPLDRPPDYAATACICPVPIGGTGPDRCGVCELPLICPKCERCRGCKLRLRFPR